MTVEACDINALLTKLSSFGKYQKRNFFLVSLAIVYSSVQYSYVFSTRSTKHRCYIEECDNDMHKPISYNQSWLKNAIPFDDMTMRKCERYAPILNSDRTEFCSSNWFNTSVIQKCDKLVIDGNDRTTIEHDFKLHCEENLWKLTVLGSIDEIAEVLFAPFVGYFSDRLGRKWVLINSLVLSGVFGMIKSFSASYLVFSIMEFLTACFTSAIYGSGFILAVELLVVEKRVFGSTLIAIVFPFGEIIQGLAAWFSPSWQFMLRVLYAPGILFICYFWLMDDSLCFLLANGKNKKARSLIKRIANANNVDVSADIYFQLKDPNKPNSTSPPNNGEVDSSNMDEDSEERRETFMQIFQHPALMVRVVICSLSWISCTFTYFGLTIYSVTLTGNVYLNFIIMAVVEVPGYVFCYFTLDLFGRRVLLMGSLLLGGFACFACSVIPQDSWLVLLILLLIGKLAATVAFKTIYIYTAEMFPTTLRHTLLAFCSMFGRAGSIAAPQLPILATVSPILPSIVFSFLGVTAGVLAFLLPETTGCKLPDTLEESLKLGTKQQDKDVKKTDNTN